jgi:hypothetical protein
LTRGLSLLLFSALPFLFTGCVHLDQSIRLGSNNTGDFSINARIPSNAIEALDGKATFPWLSPRAGTGTFPKSEGFRITKYRVYELEGYHHLKVIGELTDAKKALASGKLGHFSWVDSGNAGIIRLRKPDDYPTGAKQPDQRKLRQLLDDFRIRLTIELPAKPTATTAHTKDDRIVTWSFDNKGSLDFVHSFPDVSAAYKK